MSAGRSIFERSIVIRISEYRRERRGKPVLMNMRVFLGGGGREQVKDDEDDNDSDEDKFD